MKASKIIAGMLVLIGFGSCCNRPSKSKTVQENPEETVMPVDTATVRPIMVMYGPPRREFIPEIQDMQTGDSNSATAEEAVEEITPAPKEK